MLHGVSYQNGSPGMGGFGLTKQAVKKPLEEPLLHYKL